MSKDISLFIYTHQKNRGDINAMQQFHMRVYFSFREKIEFLCSYVCEHVKMKSPITTKEFVLQNSNLLIMRKPLHLSVRCARMSFVLCLQKDRERENE